MSQVPKDLDNLISYSRALGGSIRMIQAAGGNTSLKEGGRMWIKASGLWLKDIESAEGFVEMDIARILSQLARVDASDADMRGCVCDPEATARPSVEVPMHAVIPYRFVIHSHCIDVMALAVQRDAKTRFDKLLNGLDWAFIPYIKPGVPLSRAVAQAAESGARIFILANHGLIVAADTLAEIDTLTQDILHRLPPLEVAAPPVPKAPQISLANTGYRWAQDPLTHQIAQDPIWSDQLTTGSFAPDLLVFLGPALPMLDPYDPLTPERLRALAQAPLPINGAVILKGEGVALRQDAFRGTEELSRCARDVLASLPAESDIAYFNEQDSHDLLNWDAEKYRQALNAQEA